ncbi:hypothetical protein G4B88_027166, partial [Cannabis sativa]
TERSGQKSPNLYNSSGCSLSLHCRPTIYQDQKDQSPRGSSSDMSQVVIDGFCGQSEGGESLKNVVKNRVVNDGEHDENQSPNVSSVDIDGEECQTPKLSSVNECEMDVDYSRFESSSVDLSESGSGVKDEEEDLYLVPDVGIEFESEDHAYKCYSRYAVLEGFSIRKDFVNKSRIDGAVVSRRYTCYRQGYRPVRPNSNARKPRQETRTGCLAHMTIARQTNDKFRVTHFETKHNHEFVNSSTTHMLPSQKRAIALHWWPIGSLRSSLLNFGNGLALKQRLGFKFPAAVSVLKLKGVDENGDLVLFLLPLKNFEQLDKERKNQKTKANRTTQYKIKKDYSVGSNRHFGPDDLVPAVGGLSGVVVVALDFGVDDLFLSACSITSLLFNGVAVVVEVADLVDNLVKAEDLVEDFEEERLQSLKLLNLGLVEDVYQEQQSLLMLQHFPFQARPLLQQLPF